MGSGKILAGVGQDDRDDDEITPESAAHPRLPRFDKRRIIEASRQGWAALSGHSETSNAQLASPGGFDIDSNDNETPPRRRRSGRRGTPSLESGDVAIPSLVDHAARGSAARKQWIGERRVVAIDR